MVRVEITIDTKSGVPFYRQIIEQVKFGIAQGGLIPGHQLPTVRQLAVSLSINPNTVIRAYRELEIEGLLDSYQGSGTFISSKQPNIDDIEKERMLDQIVTDLLARASSYGFSLEDVMQGLAKRKESSS